MTKSEFIKLLCTEENKEMYYDEYWIDIVLKIVEKMYDDFPQGESPCWDDPESELAYWSSINLDSQSRATGTWIKRRIQTLKWLQKWTGVERVKTLRRNYLEYYMGFDIYIDREGGLNAELQSRPRFFAERATNVSLAKIKQEIDEAVKNR